MKHYEFIAVPQQVKEKYVKTTCDICGEDTSTATFEVNRVELSHEIGESYPECYMTETYAPDICGDCFADKIKPFIESLGCSVIYKDDG